jgi:hypothetical protein
MIYLLLDLCSGLQLFTNNVPHMMIWLFSRL